MEESDQKAGEDASGSDKMAGAASGSDEKAIDKRPPLRSRLSADAPAFIPRGHFQNRPPRSTSPVTPSTLSPVDTPPSVHSSSSTSSVSASSTGERRRHRPATDPRPQHRPAADSPGKGKASTTGKAGPHDRSHQRPASNSPHPALPPQNLARRFESSAPASSRPPVPALPQNLGPRVENSPPTSSRPPVPAFPLPPQNLGPHFEDSAPASSPVPTLPQNLGPRVENSPPASSRPPAPTVTHNLGPHTENYPPASSRPQVPAFSDVLRHGPATAAKMMQYKDAMLRYLNHESCDHYKEEASRLGRRLTIDFVDLMWKDKDLAENICNNRGTNTFWLKQAAKAFFDANNLPSDDVTLDFKNIPSRLLSARKHMETLPCTQRRSICGGITTINEATLHGRRGADVILTGILDCISAGVSWCGRLSFEDLWFGEEPDGTLKLYIAKQPTYTENAPTNYRVLDVKAIWPAIKGALSLVDGKLPLYFQELQSDLENARGLPDWFFTYLRFHPALYASMPCSNLIISVQKSCRRFKIASDKKFNRVFSGKPLSSGDWRRRAKTGALNQLLKFKLMEKNKGNKNSENSTNLESSAGKKKETGVTEEDSAGKAPGTSEGLEKTSGRSLGNVVMPTPMGASEDECQSPGTLYIDTNSSLLDYNRNGLSHLDQYVEIEDEDEIELYLAYHFPEILPAVIRGLLDECGMGGCFQSAWDTYKKTK